MAPLAWSIVVAWLVAFVLLVRSAWRATDSATRRNVLQLLALTVALFGAIVALGWAIAVLVQ